MSRWLSPIVVKVARDGTVTMSCVRRYWSVDSVRLAGCWVDAMEERDRCELVIQYQGREYVLGLIEDLTKRNPEVEAIARDLVVRRRKEALLQLIDQRIERALRQNFVRPGKFVELLGNLYCRICQPRKASLKQAEHRDLHAPDHADIVSELLDLIFEHRAPLVGGHFQGSSPEAGGFENPTAAAEAAHRLSENRK